MILNSIRGLLAVNNYPTRFIILSDGVSEQAIDAPVRRLRDRIAELDPEHQSIITVRGHGFRLDNSM